MARIALESVAHEHDRATAATQLVHLLRHLLLEFDVAAGEGFVDQQNLRIEMGGDGESEASPHSRRVRPHREVEVLPELRELADRFRELGQPFLGEPHCKSAEGDVLPPGHRFTEADANREERGDATANHDLTGVRCEDARDRSEQCRLPGAVPADHAEHCPSWNSERHVAQRGHESVRRAGSAQEVEQSGSPRGVEMHAVRRRHVVDLDRERVRARRPRRRVRDGEQRLAHEIRTPGSRR